MIERRRTSMRMAGHFQFCWLVFAAAFWVGAAVALANTHSGAWVLPVGVLAVALGTAIEFRAVRVVARIEPDVVVARNHLRSWRVAFDDIALIYDHPAIIPLDRSMLVHGRLEILTWNGVAVPLAGTSGAKPAAIIPFIDELIAAAPEAHLCIDLGSFPNSSTPKRGTGRYGPKPPAPELALTQAQLREELRKRQDAGRAELEELKRELQRIKAGKRS